MINKWLISAILLLGFVACNSDKAKPDDGFDVSVADPKLKTLQPRVLFDEAHHNHHTIETTYKPFADLISNDGAVLSSTGKPIDPSVLANANLYIIATAMGKEDPGDQSPFAQSEMDDLEKRVQEGWC